MTKATGRKPNESPVFREGDLEAIVARDPRIRDLVPSHNGIAASVSFEAYQAIRAEFPDADTEEVLKIWHSRLDRAGGGYVSKLVSYLSVLHDDIMSAARFQSLDAKDDVPQRVGMRPTTDDAKRINNWFSDRLAAFRRGGFDKEGLDIVESIRTWARANRPIFTKTSAFQSWHKKLRFRERYRQLEQHINLNFRSVSKDD